MTQFIIDVTPKIIIHAYS